MGPLAFPLLAIVTFAAGWGWTARWPGAEGTVAGRVTACGLAGLLILVLPMLVHDLAGIAWNPWIVGLPVTLAAAVLLAWPPRRGPEPRSAVRWNPGDGVALGTLGVFMAATAARWNVHSDFVYHWGVKAERFYLAGGLDVDFLTRAWNAGHLHPDYPNFVPVLGAATATLAGRFEPLPVLSWSVVWFALALAAGRELLHRAGASRWGLAAGLAVLGLVLATFGIGYLQAGGADLPIALAVLAGGAALLARPGPGADREIALAAAFAAACKIEGLVLGALLIAVHGWRRWAAANRPRPRELAGAALRSTWPMALAVALWAVPVMRHDLFSSDNAGAFDLGRFGLVAGELFRALLTPNWHGLTFVLFALPFLALVPRLRPVVAVCAIQLGFYVYVYLSAPVDPAHYVQTSAARLLFHVVPTVLLLAVVALDERAFPGEIPPSRAQDGDVTPP